MEGMDLIAGSTWEAAYRVVRCLCREHLSPGCVDLMRHSGVRVYTRPQELRLIEVFAGPERSGTLYEESS